MEVQDYSGMGRMCIIKWDGKKVQDYWEDGARLSGMGRRCKITVG
jgi:hypothetical protein